MVPAARAREDCRPVFSQVFDSPRHGDKSAGRLHLKDAPVLGAHADERCADGRSEVFSILEGTSYVPCMGPGQHNELGSL